jgi:hypothetical protein
VYCVFAPDDAGDDRAVVAHADVRAEQLVLLRHLLQAHEQLVFAERPVFGRVAELERRRHPDRLRNRLADELVEVPCADRFEHRADRGVVGADVAAYEGVVRLQERGQGRHGSAALYRRRDGKTPVGPAKVRASAAKGRPKATPARAAAGA